MEINKSSELKIKQKPTAGGKTINTPNGRHTFKPVSASRKTALNSIIRDLNSGHGSFGDMIAHYGNLAIFQMTIKTLGNSCHLNIEVHHYKKWIN